MNIRDIVLSIPHASVFIPESIRSLIPHDDLMLNHEADLYTDRIYTIDGPRIVQAQTSRIISDANRAPDEIYAEGKSRSNGVVMLALSDGMDTFSSDPPLPLMERWVKQYHGSFHRDLSSAMAGAKFLIDGHSHWSRSPAYRSDAGTERADIILGSRHYTTCDAETLQFFRHFFRSRGYTVAVNDPFIGRYIIGIHCSRLRTPGIQLEMKRSLYMDEDTLDPQEGNIERLHEEFRQLVGEFCRWEEAGRPAHMVDLSD